ncbi:MAG: methyl-accepting chemotaxis protein [Sideroxydans sp.]|jgi:methyl-accepting chemotaxis protein
MLNDLKISTRLIVMLSVLIVSMLIIGGVGLYTASKGNQAMHSMYNDRLMPLVQLDNVRRNMLNNRLAIADAAIYPELMKSNADIVAANKAEIDRNWEAYMATFMYDDELALAKHYTETRGQFVEQFIKPAIAAMRAGDQDKLKELQRHGQALYEPARDDMNALVELQQVEATKIFKQNDADFSTTRIVSITLILIAGLLGLGLGLSIIRGVNISVESLRGVMVKMGQDGDLTVRAKVHGKDELGQAAMAFNGLIEGFSSIIRQVNSNANTVSASAANLASSSGQIAVGSQAQSEAAASTAAAVEEITVSINSVASNAESVRKLSEQSLRQTKDGNLGVEAMVGEIESVQSAVNQIDVSVKEFVESTRAIAGMTQQVKEIADQTNLLALNAAIEAARAGEQGRGFAVVADEVRKLAEKSAQSANEIDQVTNSLNKKSGDVEATVQSGLRSLRATQEQVERVSALLAEAGSSVEQSTQGVNDIATSVSEQGIASTEIAKNVEKIAQMSEENHAAVRSNSDEVLRLEQMARELQSAVGRFRA